MAFPPQSPGPGYGAPPVGPPPGWPGPGQAERPPDHTASLLIAFGLSVSSFFCCSLLAVIPLVFAIVAAVQASGGNHDGARTMAKTSSIVAGVMMALGILGWIVYLVFIVVLGVAGSASGY